MVYIDTETLVSETVQEKSRNCFVRKRTSSEYIVKPKIHGKARRLVSFRLRGGLLLANCRDLHTNEPCPANLHHAMCYHVSAALRRAEINARRQQGKAA